MHLGTVCTAKWSLLLKAPKLGTHRIPSLSIRGLFGLRVVLPDLLKFKAACSGIWGTAWNVRIKNIIIVICLRIKPKLSKPIHLREIILRHSSSAFYDFIAGWGETHRRWDGWFPVSCLCIKPRQRQALRYHFIPAYSSLARRLGQEPGRDLLDTISRWRKPHQVLNGYQSCSS